MSIIHLSLGSLAAKFGLAPGNNPDSDETYPAWIAWRMSGALISAAVGYAFRDKGVASSAVAGFAIAFLVTDIASKVVKANQ